jgi:hypothetical protein
LVAVFYEFNFLALISTFREARHKILNDAQVHLG